MSVLSPTTCKPCEALHGKIEDISVLNGYEEVAVTINAHPNDKCMLVRMRTIKVETATSKGNQGADAYLFFLHKLPLEYVTKEEAENAGWRMKKGNLDTVLSGKGIGLSKLLRR